ncbi:MAG: DUF423 domain-containing protein [Opitutus sp.]
MNDRTALCAAGLFGATGVALGAFGAHALSAVLAERGMTNAWETAVRYHLLHAVTLFVLALWFRQTPPRATTAMAWAARSWILGILLFSGSLYGLALGGPRWLGPITPLGGICLMAGWLLLVAAALSKRD